MISVSIQDEFLKIDKMTTNPIVKVDIKILMRFHHRRL